MGQTRYSEVYAEGTGIIIDFAPYEVSDEQLEREAEDARCLQILSNPPPAITMPEVRELLVLYAKRLSFPIP